MTLQEWRALAEAATPGPWTVEEHRLIVDGKRDAVAMTNLARPVLTARRDTNYIAASHPQRILAALKVIEAARELRANIVWLIDGPRPPRIEKFDAALAALEGME